ncbi:sugar ABC transporter permease [Peptoniphilus equinus]|uniref:Sugar ABC transporter permease n=1 Tax=Peptoniphilus equinus TaxID=3016343 RepID=A0ABY7QUU9_9FIRM|nr:sugar ABC transporter permease [Peptoniphilus equinus]WBW49810.1 sugar ABC transporter permease [Peptoniphilus equinus]
MGSNLRSRLSLPQWALYIVVPMLPLIIFWFIPLVVSVLISFTNWDYISPTYDIVGLKNYGDILTSDTFLKSLGITVQFGLGTVLPTLVIGFFLAYLLNDKLEGKAWYQTFIFSPWITPMVAMSIVWSWMYRPEGFINVLLGAVGIDVVPWLTDSRWALLAVMIVTVWKNAGYAMIFYADALSKIPKSLYEVGFLEGASTWQKIRCILLPMVKSTTFFLIIVNLISSLQAYDQISVLTQGGPSGSTRTLLYLYYQMAFEEFNMGRATALAVIMVFITGLFAFVLFAMKRKGGVR